MERRTGLLVKDIMRRNNTFGDSEGGGPLIAEDIETNASIRINVRMIDSCREIHLAMSVQPMRK